MEAQLGVRLVECSTRRFKVTNVGEEVYRHGILHLVFISRAASFPACVR